MRRLSGVQSASAVVIDLTSVEICWHRGWHPVPFPRLRAAMLHKDPIYDCLGRRYRD